MTFQAGDRVVAESESIERPARYGTVREVVREDPRPLSHRVGRRAHERVYAGGRRAPTRARERQAGGVTTGRRCRAQRLRARVGHDDRPIVVELGGCATRSRWG